MEEDEKSIEFHQMGLDDRVLEAIARLNWEHPTAIQEKAIPLFLKGKDILARAYTGSGKTGSYLIPLVHKILETKVHASNQSISTLILAPSKELSHQIVTHTKHLTVLCRNEVKVLDLSTLSLEAGKPFIEDLPDIIVGTPSKILGHMKEGNLVLKTSLRYLVIDEADLMFAFDFQDEIKAVLKHLPTLRHSFITSATLPDDVKNLKILVLNKPAVLKLEEPPVPTDCQLSQFMVKASDFDKIVLLYGLFKLGLLTGKTLIFVNSVNRAYKIRLFLTMFGIKSCVLNAEMPIESRLHVMHQFNQDKYSIMIASDEIGHTKKGGRSRDPESGVSRGIDFECLSNVVNVDAPLDAPTYLHRVGRTARASRRGSALTMVSPWETKGFQKMLKQLAKILPSGKPTIQDFKFNMAALDGFKYRAKDAWKQCTTIAIRDLRRQELKKEFLNSEKLKKFFDDNPTDLQVITHEVKPKGVRIQRHLSNVPIYNVPKALKKKYEAERRTQKRIPTRNNKDFRLKYFKKEQDPLRGVKNKKKRK